jgi:hypothetical protein
MAFFPPFIGPRAALADLRAFMRQRSREQLFGAVFACLCTLVIVVIFFLDSKVNTAPPPRIVYVEQWRADRSDAEIIAEQKADQAKRDAAKRERQEQFRRIDRKLDDLNL